MAREGTARRVAIIGGGVIGLSIARAAARAGCAVEVLERDRIGGGASSAASGIVTLGLHGKSAFRRLRREGFSAMERWLPTLPAVDGAPVGEFRPAVRLFPEPPPNPTKLLEAWRAAGHTARFVPPSEIAEHLPDLDRESVHVGLLFDREIIVDPDRLLRSLAADVRRHGGVIEEQLGALSIEPVGDDAVRVVDGSGNERANRATHVVVTAGWRSLAALSPLPTPPLPLAPVGGIGIEVDLPGDAGDWTVHFGEKGRRHRLVRGRRDGATRVYLGSTVRAEGSSDGPTEEEIAALLEAAQEHFGGSIDRSSLVVHDGLRPKTTLLGGPLVGAFPGRARLWIATGHYRVGVAACAATAESLLAAWGLPAAADPPHGDFAVDRGWTR